MNFKLVQFLIAKKILFAFFSVLLSTDSRIMNILNENEKFYWKDLFITT